MSTDAPSAILLQTPTNPTVVSSTVDLTRSSDSPASTAAKQLAAMLDLITLIESAENRDEAAATLCENLANYLEADHVIVALADERARVRVVAASNQDQIDETQERNRLAQALLQEAVCREEISVWPARSDARHALLCHRQYAEFHSHRVATVASHSVAIGCPLRDSQGTLQGAVLVSHTSELPNHVLPFLATAQRPLATTLNLLRRAEQSRFHRGLRNFFAAAHRDRLKTTLLGAVLLATVLCLPIHYTVKAPCKLEPTNKRFLAAPFSGKLLRCFVEPGDAVELNQLLAHLDGQETEWELASIHAELQRAIQERAGHVSLHESGKSRLIQHEIEFLRSKSKLLTNRIAQLEVRSPVAGIIVSGDLTKSEGVPLEIGQTLFEIAPLDAMVAEVSVPEDDVRFITAELPVRIHFDAFPYEPRTTLVRKIRPRAEVRDDEHVFVADADIENTDNRLRPGMKGTARIKTVRRPIGWILFHKPVAAVVGWLGL